MKARNLNFRQTKSERVAERSYSNFRKGLVKMFKNKFIKAKENYGAR